MLACLDGYMNIALEQTEEYSNGQVRVQKNLSKMQENYFTSTLMDGYVNHVVSMPSSLAFNTLPGSL